MSKKILPISSILKSNRVKYLHYLITRKPSHMLYKFTICQWFEPKSGDWTEQVKWDLKDLKIPCDLEWMKKQTKSWFKQYVNEKVKEFTFQHLQKEQQKLSKIKDINYETFELQSYLKCSDLNTDLKRKLLAYRMKMLDFGENFRGPRSSVACPFQCLGARDFKVIFMIVSQ